MSEEDDNDAVGYKRPPKHTRFQKGKSGNPSGKAKTPKRSDMDDVAESVKRALGRHYKVTENNRTRKMRKADILGEQIVNAALGKNVAMAKLAIDLERRANEIRRAQPQDDFSQEEAAIFDDLLKRLAEPDTEGDTENGDGDDVA
jgi:hypothetical protein